MTAMHRTSDASGAAGIRIRPAPRREPPFDDEDPTPHLRLIGPHDRPLPFALPSRRRITEPRGPFSIRPTSRGELPDPEVFGRRLLVATFETLANRRPLQQLAPHLSQSVYSGLALDLEHPVPSRAWRRERPAVCSVRLCEPADGVAELAIVVQAGTRRRAVALRLEGLDGRWRCVRMQMG